MIRALSSVIQFQLNVDGLPSIVYRLEEKVPQPPDCIAATALTGIYSIREMPRPLADLTGSMIFVCAGL